MRGLVLLLFTTLAQALYLTPTPALVVPTLSSQCDKAIFPNRTFSNVTTHSLTLGFSITCNLFHGSDLNRYSCDNAWGKTPLYAENQESKHRHRSPLPSDVYVYHRFLPSFQSCKPKLLERRSTCVYSCYQLNQN